MSTTTTTSTATATASTTDFKVVADISEWKKQLITKEDPAFIHKALGISCLCSFVWRYMHIGSSDMGFISHPEYTVPTLLLHFMLTASAFIFKIPNKRIKDGTRIWPEYRMHAMVFLCRSLAVIGRYWYETKYELPRNYDYNFAVVILTMAAADLCSASVEEKYRSNSVRDVDTPPVVKFFFSSIQFLATSAYLMGLKRYSFPFLTVMVVQLTPFLATLRRKHLIGRDIGSFLYGVYLVNGYVVSQYFTPVASVNMLRITNGFGIVAATWRLMPLPSKFRFLQNKYLIWTTLGLLMRYLRPYFTQWTYDQIMVVVRIELVIFAFLAFYKIKYGYSNSSASDSPKIKKV